LLFSIPLTQTAMLKRVEVRTSKIPNAGNGLFALTPFQIGEIICEYTGKQLTLLQAVKLTDKRYLMGGFGLNCHLDAQDHPESLGRYINDPMSPSLHNVEFVKLKDEKKALVRATREIQVCNAFTSS